MRILPSIGLMLVTAVVLSVPALAQQQAALPGTPPANSNLSVASVKIDSGARVSKLVGSSVYNDQGDKIGSIDDLIVTPDDKLTTAIISVGGFLGVGGKLVAVPYDKLKIGADLKIVMPGANRDALTGMPSFTYSG
jgi:sporulation protein YlmC with PRC-barrel domain